MNVLREAFSEHHALQCGFCTPGMLMTARDIVTRLPDADERRIRLELSGNLCRCTGYVGIVEAVQSALATLKTSGHAGVPARPADRSGRLAPPGEAAGLLSEHSGRQVAEEAAARSEGRRWLRRRSTGRRSSATASNCVSRSPFLLRDPRSGASSPISIR